MKKISMLLTFTVLAPLFTLAVAPFFTTMLTQDGSMVATIDGVAVTGANRLLGQPVWDLGEPFGPGGFNFVYGYNEGGDEPFDLTPETPGNTLVATGADPILLAMFGMTLDDIDPDMMNVPFRDVAVIVDPAGGRAQVPSVLDVPGFAPSKSLPNDDITLDEWLAAKGKLFIRCHADGTADIRVRLRKVITNGVYTLWGVFGLDMDEDGAPDSIIPMALGGVPNVMIGDKNGRASIERTINFCPMAEPSMRTINIAWHSDGSAYGAVPELPLAGLPGGIITHDQINFPINVAGPASAAVRVGVAPAAGEAAPAETSRFELDNYPNPFNPSTTVAYSLPQAQQVRLSVYDVLGREVRRLVDGDQAAGRHEVVFDASTLPSGTYFYRIETPSGVQTRKLVLLK